MRQALRVNSFDRRFLLSPGVAWSYGRTAVRPFSEQGVVLGGTVRRPPCRRVSRETGDDSVRVGSGVSTPGPTSTRTRVRAVHYLIDDPQSGTPCRMAPQSREGCTALIFMRRFWQQFTYGGNFKAVSGFQPRIIFARSQNWQLWAKNVAASDNRGVSARSQSCNYFEETHFARAKCVSS